MCRYRLFKPPSNPLFQAETIQPTSHVIHKLHPLLTALSQARYPVLLIGAGLSTMSRIPDYRSPKDTILPTGAGRWNRTPQYQAPAEVVAISAFPNDSHFYVKAMMSRFKKILSQNVDPLLADCGIPDSQLSHLHGQINREVCLQCDKCYIRRYYVFPRTENPPQSPRWGGRYCSCGGKLCDSIVHFRDRIHQEAHNSIEQAKEKADFILSLGSSLFVNTARKVVQNVLQRGHQVYQINLQRNQYSTKSSHIQQQLSVALPLLLKQLNISLPLEYQKQVVFNYKIEGRKLLSSTHDGLPVELFGKVYYQRKEVRSKLVECHIESDEEIRTPIQVEILSSSKKMILSQREGKVIRDKNGWRAE